MHLFNFLKPKPKRLKNITVYYLSEIIDGNAFSSPLGTIPRFSDHFENEIRIEHKPSKKSFSYINEEINDKTVILFWQNDCVEAINFLSKIDAQEFPELSLFEKEDLEILDRGLCHFPRRAVG